MSEEVKVDGGAVKESLRVSKLPLNLIPPQFLEGLAKVLEHGAKKYAPHNWMRGMSIDAVFAATMRHVEDARAGRMLDTGQGGSGLPVLYHAVCELMFLTWYLHGPNAEQYKAFDDRKFKVSE